VATRSTRKFLPYDRPESYGSLKYCMFSRLNRSLVIGRRLSSDTRMLQSAAGDDRILLSNLSKVRGLSNVLMIMLISLRIVRYNVSLPAIVATIRVGSNCLIAGNSCARLGSQRSCSVLDVGFLAMRLKLPELAFTPIYPVRAPRQLLGYALAGRLTRRTLAIGMPLLI